MNHWKTHLVLVHKNVSINKSYSTRITQSYEVRDVSINKSYSTRITQSYEVRGVCK